MSKAIQTVCIPCGKANDKKHKGVMGVWIGTCDMCGAKDTGCAAAGHDFGIYANEEDKEFDRIQDLI